VSLMVVTLRSPPGIVHVRFAIPGFRSLQQDFAVAARYVLRAALGEDGRQECSGHDRSHPSATIFRKHVDYLDCGQAMVRLLVDLDLKTTKE
jgi:hypothetical protein